jgi:hypothetical protein
MQKLTSCLPHVCAEAYETSSAGKDPPAINEATALRLLEYVQLPSSNNIKNCLLLISCADDENVNDAVCDIVLQWNTIYHKLF